MSFLFVDSTYDLTLGLLDEDFNWLSFETHKGQKASAIIQERVYSLLLEQKLSPQNLKAIITVNGPGFYTGLRLAEGFADVFKFFNIPNYSFYSYEVPLWCGHQEGIWFTKAYRGEYFLYEWSEKGTHTKLLTVKELPAALSTRGQVFIHSAVSLDEASSSSISNPISTSVLLKAHSHEVFKTVVELALNRNSFYFRAPEDEFKVNP